MSWPWIALLAVAVALVVATEWPRVARAVGADARRQRARQKQKSKLRVVEEAPADDDFIRSVQADLDALPTIDEHDRGPR